nr:hypothetical protein [Tanacetum cinerariifolium]
MPGVLDVPKINLRAKTSLGVIVEKMTILMMSMMMTELYKDVNVKWNVAEHGEKEKGDAEMTDIDVGYKNVTQKTSFDQVKDDAYVTITKKTEVPLQSSFVSPDFAAQFLNLDNIPPADIEVVSMMNVKELSKLKQANQFAQLLKTIKSQIPAMVDAHLGTRLGDSIQEAFRSYTAEFKKRAQAEMKRYIDLVEKSVKDIINDEVKTQVP